RAVVAQLGVRLRSIEQAAGTLSGGNQQKVVLGRWLSREPAVLILDEPTRGVDVGAREEIYALVHRLAKEGRAVVMISWDLPEVIGQSDRVVVFREGRVAGEVAAAAQAELVAGLALRGHDVGPTAVSNLPRKRQVGNVPHRGGVSALREL